jgi:NitT/TauT family transport system ATP-binding protein
MTNTLDIRTNKETAPIMNAAPILDVQKISKRYATTPYPILQELTFTQKEGEFLAIVGPSGCGKTTLLRSLAGLMTTDSGKVLHRGETLGKPPAWLSIVFQDYSRSLYPWLTVRKNVIFALNHLDRHTREDRTAESLEAVGLSHAADMYPWQLSGGMQQRCALARSIAASPQLLFLDEPFASVDAQTRIDLQDMVAGICSERKLSTLLVTHDIDEAIYLADRVLVLSTRPAQVVEEIEVKLERPRDQLATKETPEFLQLRHRVFTSVRREAQATPGVQDNRPLVAQK